MNRIPAPGGAVGLGQAVRNSYAEKHWPVEDEAGNAWVTEFQEAVTPDAKTAVILRKQATGPEQLAGLVRRALREPDEQIRIDAVQTLTSFVTLPDEAADLVAGAVHDPSPEVRAFAMEAVRELLPDTRLAAYKQTITAPEPEVRRMTIVELGRMATKPAFEILMTGLQNQDPTFRDQVNFEIKLLVNRRFEGYEEAIAWWDGAEEKNFNDGMIRTAGG